MANERVDINRMFNTNDQNPNVQTSTFYKLKNIEIGDTNIGGCGSVDQECLETMSATVTADTPLAKNLRIPACFNGISGVWEPQINDATLYAVSTAMADSKIIKAIEKLKGQAVDKTGLQIESALKVVGQIVETLLVNGVEDPRDIVLFVTPQLLQKLSFEITNVSTNGFAQATGTSLRALGFDSIEGYIIDTFGIGDVVHLEGKLMNNGKVRSNANQTDYIDIIGLSKDDALYKVYCETPTQLVFQPLGSDPTAIKPYYRVVTGAFIGANLFNTSAFCYGKGMTPAFEAHVEGEHAHPKAKATQSK
nr:MAG TPA: hypothetical protein [Caudoviricetes sp.]